MYVYPVITAVLSLYLIDQAMQPEWANRICALLCLARGILRLARTATVTKGITAMEAMIKGQVISVGATRSWTNRRGEAQSAVDAYMLIGSSPNPVRVQADPSLNVKQGEAAIWEADVFPSRFSDRDLSVRIKTRMQPASAVRSA